VKRKLLLWQRQVIIALIAAICSISISWLWHVSEPPNIQANTEQVEVASTSIPQAVPEVSPSSENLNISGIKTASKSQVKALNQQIAELVQPQLGDLSLPQEFQGKTIAETTLSSKRKVIALTFDDGPWPHTTEQVLDILQQNGIKATFFWIGNNLKTFPEIGRLVVDAGHAIGNHTWHHWYRAMDRNTAAREIENTAALIYQTTGVKTSLFRPPGGFLNNGPAGYAKQKNYAVMMWSADSRDWFYRLSPAQVLVNIVLREAKPGGIVLMHDGGGDRSKTVKALPRIIAELKQRGYEFVTVPELLAIKDQEIQLAKAKSNKKTI